MFNSLIKCCKITSDILPFPDMPHKRCLALVCFLVTIQIKKTFYFEIKTGNARKPRVRSP